eukprot:SAG31_NODE_240_length_19407_cov_29.686140_10_plen_69_part_00
MKFAAATLAVAFGLVASADAGATELTKSNFDDEVKNSGKNAFVKFLAPWCALVTTRRGFPIRIVYRPK